MSTPDTSGLTDRQREAYALYAEGTTRPVDIAKAMNITPNAARLHLKRLQNKGLVPKTTRRRRQGRTNGSAPVGVVVPEAETLAAGSDGLTISTLGIPALTEALDQIDQRLKANETEEERLDRRHEELRHELAELEARKQTLLTEDERITRVKTNVLSSV